MCQDSERKKILRRVYGPICENGDWRKRYNQELCKDVEISKHIRITGSDGQMRKKDQEISKKVLLAQPLSSRKRGKPWRDGRC